MSIRLFSLIGITVAIWAGALDASAQSIRCDRRVVSVGDTAYELEARCGPPAHRSVVVDFRAVTVRDKRGNAVQQIVDEDVDVLTYAGVKGDLPRLVTVRRGIITSIRTGARVQSTADRGCAQAVLRNGATLGEVQLACGRPIDRSRWSEERAVRIKGQTLRRRFQHVRWVYDPGPGRLLRILNFENGRLIDVRTGGRSPS
ncbi:MAG: DUF2845 domain-containing protein [Myxococcota bacterium]